MAVPCYPKVDTRFRRVSRATSFSLEIIMFETLADTSEILLTLRADEIDAVAGGASIYIDGSYWGDGELNLRPWPGGFPVHYIY
jgi:hypothetical protein